MTILELSTILRELLQCNDYVTLPSMGTFVVEHIPSQIENDGKSITPPSCEIHFDSSRTEGNESLHKLALCYSERGSVSKDAADESILSLIKEIKMELLEKTYVEFPQLGTIKFSSDSQFIFESHPAFDPSAQFYGLEVLPIRKLSELESSTAQKSANNAEAGSGFTDDLLAESESVEKGFQFPLWAKLVLAIAALLVLVVLAVLLFKDELMPLLEKLLYTEEELRFIKEHGL